MSRRKKTSLSSVLGSRNDPASTVDTVRNCCNNSVSMQIAWTITTQSLETQRWCWQKVKKTVAKNKLQKNNPKSSDHQLFPYKLNKREETKTSLEFMLRMTKT